MKTNKYLIIGLIVLLLVLPACAISQIGKDNSVTQIAQNIYASQTSLALSATPSYTSSPTATSTPTETPTPSPSPTPSPTPSNTPTPTVDPSILFIDDFSDPDSGWYEYTDEDGEIVYADDGLRISIKSSDYYYWSTSGRYFSDVVIEVDAKKVSGPIDNEYGIICRYMDSANFYLFSISSDGYFGIFKLIDDEWDMIDSTDWGFNDKVIKTGAGINHMKATCNGNNLTLEVNGSILMDVTDEDLTAGDVGLYAGTYDAGGLEILFDNFKVTRP